MLSKSLSSRIVVGAGSLLVGAFLVFPLETRSFGTFLIGFSIGVGLAILEKLRGR